MFSIFKKVSGEQEVVLQDLTEEQLTLAAGGQAKNWDSHKKWVKKHHHHHHHSASHKKWSTDKTHKKTSGGMHW